MTKERIIYWLPKVLATIYLLFLGILALDIFIPNQTINYYLVALFIHLIPNFIISISLVIAWRWERLGGILFLLLGFIFTLFFNTYTAVFNFLLISAPAFLIGILFLLHSFQFQKNDNI